MAGLQNLPKCNNTMFENGRSHNGGSESKIRLLVIDDHPVIAVAVSNAVQTKLDIEYLGHAPSVEEAWDQIEALQPNLLVVDVNIGSQSGVEFVRNLRQKRPDIQAVMFSLFDEKIYAEQAIRAGASAYVMKSQPTQELVEAIRFAHREEIYLSRQMMSRVLKGGPNRGMTAPGFSINELTEQERTVFQMIGRGRDIKDIASTLNIQLKTAETYRRRAKEKLGLDTVNELVAYATRWMHEGEALN